MKPNYKFAETLLCSMMVAGATTYSALDRQVSSAEAEFTSAKQQQVKSEVDSPAANAEDPATAHAALFGLMKGQIKILPGFDDPLEEFAEYM